ncbi:hypothetical protein PybrP1_008336 [[Pythium] brassicae (nom. inval.)]|nr:hypothetical protein PybrP1_008336 [[Pythium] brassicae (nom. inval.)]
MAFRREVPSLDKLVLKYVSKSVRLAGSIVNDETIARMHRIGKPGKPRTHKVKQDVIRALLQGGRVTDDILPASFFHESMTRIEVMGAKISTAFIVKLSTICPKLHSVSLSGCFRLTDDAIEVLARNCQDLKELNIENCRKLTDLSLEHLRKHAPKLQSIDVGGNFNMTIQGITKLIEKHPNHAKFTRVHISGHAVTDNTLKVIMTKCRKLHSLSIGYCAVSDDAVISLLKKRDAMSRLCLHWNVGITDQLLNYIGTSGRNLQELNLCGVKTVSADMGATESEASAAPPPAATSEDAIEPEPERKRLKKVDFRYTTVTKEAAAAVKERYPDLHVVY